LGEIPSDSTIEMVQACFYDLLDFSNTLLLLLLPTPTAGLGLEL